MPILGALLTNLFGALGAWLAKSMAERLVVRVAATAAIIAAGAVLMALFNGKVAPLVEAMFSTAYGQFLGLAFPPVSGTCMAAYAAVWVGCLTYRLQLRFIGTTAG